jgi:hypothetical protein
VVLARFVLPLFESLPCSTCHSSSTAPHTLRDTMVPECTEEGVPGLQVDPEQGQSTRPVVKCAPDNETKFGCWISC